MPQRAAHIISSLSHSLSLQFLVGRSLSFSFSSLEHSLCLITLVYLLISFSFSTSPLLLLDQVCRIKRGCGGRIRACGAP